MKPLCFVLMPFGKKKDEKGREIDFDAIYNILIQPAIEDAGMDAVRADEEMVKKRKKGSGDNDNPLSNNNEARSKYEVAQ